MVKHNQGRERKREQRQQRNQSYDRKQLCEMTPYLQYVNSNPSPPNPNNESPYKNLPKTHSSTILSHFNPKTAQTKEMGEAYVGEDVKNSGESRKGLRVRIAMIVKYNGK